MWFTNLVIDGQFLFLGFNWMFSSKFEDKKKVLARIFPLESNCEVKIMGSGAGEDTTHFKCLLPPNVLLQYIILVLWFWYAMLLVVNVLNLALIISMLLNSAKVRSMYLMRAVGSRKVNIIVTLTLFNKKFLSIHTYTYEYLNPFLIYSLERN